MEFYKFHLYCHLYILFICSIALFSNLDTCACDIPISSATSICVLPSKKRLFIIDFSFSFNFFIASNIVIFSAQFSSVFLVSLTWSRTNSFSVPSPYTGSWSEIGSWMASKLNAISSFCTPSSFAITSIVGSFPSLFYYSFFYRKCFIG